MLPELRARVVARIHSYEAFTPMPMHTDWAGIDDIVFVSPHIRALCEVTVPEMVAHTRIHTIPNRNVLGALPAAQAPRRGAHPRASRVEQRHEGPGVGARPAGGPP